MNRKYCGQKGFTLVELLVVIAIIALLLAILMPSLQKARQQAQKVVCMSNDKQLGFAYTMFASENGRLGTLWDNGSNAYPFWMPTNDASGQYLWWHHKLGLDGYIKGLGTKAMSDFIARKLSPQEVLRCPAVKRFEANPGSDVWNTWKGTSIAFNSHLSYSYPSFGGSRPTPTKSGTYINPKNPMQIKGPYGVCVTADSSLRNIYGGYTYAAEINGYNKPDTRHGGVLTVGYLDGHVGTVKTFPQLTTYDHTSSLYADYVKFWSVPDYQN